MIHAISLRIDTPTGAPLPGRGFYQLEDDTLYVPVGRFDNNRPFFNHLETEDERVRFDIDRTGRLMLIEVALPRRRWAVDPHLKAPGISEPADVRWLDFRQRIASPSVIANERRDSLSLRFSEGAPWRWYQLTEAVFLQIDAGGHLAAAMVTTIEDDLAGQNLATFRKWLARRIEMDRREDTLSDS